MRFLTLALLLMIAAPLHAQWTVELTRDAAFLIRYDGATVVRSKYLAWGPDWKFAGVESAIGKNEGEQWSIEGEIKEMGLILGGQIHRAAEKMIFRYDISSGRASEKNIGGFVHFNLRLDPQVFGPNVAKPVLNGTGWDWTPRPGETISVRMSGIDHESYFEKNKSDEIRTFFVPRTIAAGKQSVTMTVTLPGGATRTDGASKRYEQMNRETWLQNTVNWKQWPIDLSHLNHKPAGAMGFVKADGEKLVYGDGSEARFWGTNIMAYALFNATDDAIENQAKRIAALGFNLVRIHHHDSADWSPSVFFANADNTKSLDEKSLDRIDYWVKCLKDNGVYVWLDLHVGRPFRPGDGIDGYDELKAGKTGRQAKGLSYVNKDVTARMKEFAEAYLTRTNRYTHTRYVDEPAIMGVLITNENDITQHFGNEFLKEKGKLTHAAWFGAMRDRIASERGLDKSLAWKTWEAGPSKVVLNEIEYQWNMDFIKHLHAIGVKVPIATTNSWGNDPLFSLPALTAGDVIDVHAYGQTESISSNPKYDDMSSHWIAAAQVAGKPLVITEWNTEYPQRDRFTQPLFIAATAAFQGWDAPMIYGYDQSPLTDPDKIDKFGISNDPSMISLMPTAALIFRRGDVKQAERTVVFAPGESLLMTAISPENSPSLRTISERHRLVIGMPKTPLLPWLNGVDRGDASDPSMVAEGTGDTSIQSDTGEITRDWKSGMITINTPRTRAAMGWFEGREVKIGDISVSTPTPKATIVLTSLDDQPIEKSQKLLLTAVAQSESRNKPAVAVFAEPVPLTLKLPGRFKIAALTFSGATLSDATFMDILSLSGRERTHWYVITRERP